MRVQSNQERGVCASAQLEESDIQALAKTVTVHVMERLGISGPASTNQVSRSIDGQRFSIMRTKRDPGCSLIKKMQPLVANHLRGAFVKRNDLEKVDLVIRSSSGKGLLPCNVSVQKVLKDFKLNGLDWRISLDLGQKPTRGPIVFKEIMNSANVARIDLTWQEVRNAAQKVSQLPR